MAFGVLRQIARGAVGRIVLSDQQFEPEVDLLLRIESRQVRMKRSWL